MNWINWKVSIRLFNTKLNNDFNIRSNSIPTFDKNGLQTNDKYENMNNQGMYLSNNRNVIFLNKYRNIIWLTSTIVFIFYFLFSIWEHFYPSLTFSEELFLSQQKYNYREFVINKSQSYTIGSKESVIRDTSSKSWNETQKSWTPGYLDEYRKLRIKYQTIPWTYDDELRFLKVSFGFKDISYRLNTFEWLKPSELANIKAECSANEMEFLALEKAIVRKGYTDELIALNLYFDNFEKEKLLTIENYEKCDALVIWIIVSRYMMM